MAQYELLERIGKGGMAEIFKASQTAGSGFKKVVAIKRILPHLSEDQRFIKLLIAEAKILSELHHRNVVQIYDVGLGDDGQYFLVMEFVDGTDLRHLYDDLFGGHPLPVEVALHICAELCEALDHAHLAKDEFGEALGLVHRDVSPSNVLLSKHGEVKLTDFGIAKQVEEVTGHGAVRGKFAYISPEQAVNRHVDARSDVYSVGILLYELVCHMRLFSKHEDFDALREVRAGRIEPSAKNIPGVAAPLGEIIMRALEKNPEKRFQSAGEFGAALREYRYSLKTEIADPRAAVADLVRKYSVGNRGQAHLDHSSLDADEDEEPEVGGATIVRIASTGEFDLTGLSGLNELVSSYPEPRFEDTENDQMSPHLGDLAGETISKTPDSNLAPVNLELPVEVQEDESGEVGATTKLFSVSSLGKLPEHKPATLPSPTSFRSQHRKQQEANAVGTMASPTTAGAKLATVPVAAVVPTPTIDNRDLSHSQGRHTTARLSENTLASQDAAILQAAERSKRMRTYFIAGGIGFLLFLVVGFILSSSPVEEKARSKAAMPVDAGTVADAEVVYVIDSGTQPSPTATKKRNRRKQGRKKRKR